MRSLNDIEAALDRCECEADPTRAARELLALAEEILEQWIVARGEAPTESSREGFRLLTLHRQGAQNLPSFNACRETCREIAYHYNLIVGASSEAAGALARHQCMMTMLARHLYLFVSGKMQVEGLGDFCCASRPLRTEAAAPSLSAQKVSAQ